MTIRWALLGTGRHAERSVVEELKQASGSELVAAVSRERERGEAFARRHGIASVHSSLAAALNNPGIDALYDATPDGLHAQHAIAAAEAGKHILIEKPLAMSVQECLPAIAACRRRGVQLGVVFNQRHEAAHREARRLVNGGDIGEVLQAEVQIPMQPSAPLPPSAVSWRADPAMRSGGIMMSIGDHAYDTLAYVVGQDIVEVSAFTDTSGRERVASMLLKLSKGAIGYAVASSRTPFARRPFAIHGTKGSLFIENSYAYLAGAGDDPRPALTVVNETGHVTRHFAPTPCFRLEIEQFNRAIGGQGTPTTTPDEGLRALAITEALYAALRGGRVATVAEFLPRGA